MSVKHIIHSFFFLTVLLEDFILFPGYFSWVYTSCYASYIIVYTVENYFFLLIAFGLIKKKDL